ncbi:MAG: hypothetical protein H0V07_08450, partial [Propionibacteriales bacterium]|nr:hypothetical protein [Propionibacteriales bacterium]
MFGFHRSRTFLAAVALVATLVVVAAVLFTRQGKSTGDSDETVNQEAGAPAQGRGGEQSELAEASGSTEMSEALDNKPGLASHRLPLAFVTEKLEQQGGEASSEIVNGPAQEQYDQRAYPKSFISPDRVDAAARAFLRARTRSTTQTGQQALSEARIAHRWTSIGPSGGLALRATTYTGTPAVVSGRTTSLAIGNTCTKARCVLYAGTAGGGVWRSDDARSAEPRWVPIGSDIPSNAIGSVYLAKNGDLYVGTGEANGSGDSEAGVGLFKSTNDGKTFGKVATDAHGIDFTVDRAISSIAIDPNDRNHIYVGTAVARHGLSSASGGRFTPPGSAKVGVYETTNAGRTWRRSLAKRTDVVDPSTPNGSDFFRGGISKIR